MQHKYVNMRNKYDNMLYLIMLYVQKIMLYIDINKPQ